jgi:hypothetical protein
METRNRKSTAKVPPPPSLPPSSTFLQERKLPLHPLLPTRLELALLSIYPITLLAGSLFTTLSPTPSGSDAIYSATHQSFQPPGSAPSYFATKRNLFNVWFVKIGWFWTTLALVLFVFTHRFFKTVRSRTAALLRYGAITGLWYLTTQWFFGPPLIDRSFLLTGGACQRIKDGKADMEPIEFALTNAACKMQGGTWSGGIDISGHVFLLILGSGMLWMEVLPVVLRVAGLREERRVVQRDATVGYAGALHRTEKADGEEDVSAAVVPHKTGLGVRVVIGVCALSWWMLLMTAAYFHTWTEKLGGLVVAFFGLWMVYFLPRGVPALRSVFGMPGF